MSGKKLAFRLALVAALIIAFPYAVIAVIYFLNNGNPFSNHSPYENNWVSQEVPAHLKGMGYKDEDFASTNRVLPDSPLDTSYYASQFVVIFKDEPTIEYRYGVKKWGKDVVQFCEKGVLEEPNVYLDETTKKTLHSEDECDTMN